MKNSTGFSYTLSAFMIVALIAFLGGYYLSFRAKTTVTEGFDSGSCTRA
jgi:hypothetical protein